MLRSVLRIFRSALRSAYYFLHQGYYSMVGGAIRCNICGFTADHLSDDGWHRHSICPRCGSGVRQRLLWQLLTEHVSFNAGRMLEGKDVLHFAPERYLRDRIRNVSGTYRTADYFAPGYHYADIDLDLDISSMSAVKDASVDCLIVCDVLEHVLDDHKALTEIHRVLRRDGYCLLTVPQRDHSDVTESDTSPLSPEERERRFGQRDHYRIYGNDFAARMVAAGFRVTAVDEKEFDVETVRRHVLFPPELSKHPLATNYRKVYVGQKA